MKQQMEGKTEARMDKGKKPMEGEEKPNKKKGANVEMGDYLCLGGMRKTSNRGEKKTAVKGEEKEGEKGEITSEGDKGKTAVGADEEESKPHDEEENKPFTCCQICCGCVETVFRFVSPARKVIMVW